MDILYKVEINFPAYVKNADRKLNEYGFNPDECEINTEPGKISEEDVMTHVLKELGENETNITSIQRLMKREEKRTEGCKHIFRFEARCFLGGFSEH